jgi:hypothetical protein
MKTTHVIRIFFLAAILNGCAFHDSAIRGQVVELINPQSSVFNERFKPISDAYVLASWNGYHFAFPEPGQVCINNTLVKSDSNGFFIVPGWWHFPKLYPVFDIHQSLRVYKKGYVSYGITQKYYEGDPQGLVVLVKDIRNNNLRLSYLGLLTWVGSCNTDYVWEYDPNFDEWYKALYEEATSLSAPTDNFGRGGLSDVRDKALKALNRK